MPIKSSFNYTCGRLMLLKNIVSISMETAGIVYVLKMENDRSQP